MDNLSSEEIERLYNEVVEDSWRQADKYNVMILLIHAGYKKVDEAINNKECVIKNNRIVARHLFYHVVWEFDPDGKCIDMRIE